MSACIVGPIGTETNDWYAEIWCATIASALGGHTAMPVAESGQSPCIRPSAPKPVKLENTTSRNDASTSGTSIFLNRNVIRSYYTLVDRKRSELPTTEMLENAIAAPAKIGLNRIPNDG